MLHKLQIKEAMESKLEETDNNGFRHAWNAKNLNVGRVTLSADFAVLFVKTLTKEKSKDVKNIALNSDREEFLPVKETREQIYKSQCLIDNAIEDNFIKPKSENSGFVILTSKGARFITFTGLLKELIKEAGVVITFFIGLMGALIAGAYQSEKIISFFQWLINH